MSPEQIMKILLPTSPDVMKKSFNKESTIKEPLNKPWVYYDSLDHTVRTKDGTVVAAELCDNTERFLDFLYIASIREKQRKEMKDECKEH